jgi:hypothetical protein
MTLFPFSVIKGKSLDMGTILELLDVSPRYQYSGYLLLWSYIEGGLKMDD